MMFRRFTLLVWFGLATASSDARPSMDFDVPTLFARATMAVCGKVEKIEPLGIETTLTYPTLDGIRFSWLRVSIRVAATLKGQDKQAIDVAMLSLKNPKERIGMANGPGMIWPVVGRSYALFLAPSSIPDVMVSLGAPYDEDAAMFSLDRKSVADGFLLHPPEKSGRRLSEKEQLLADLTKEYGVVNMVGVAKVRAKYKKHIAKITKATTIPLEWKKVTDANGWSVDVPVDAPGGKSKRTDVREK